MRKTPTGRLYIIAGRNRGARLRTVPGQSVRPTLSRVREALFNKLASRMPDSSFLDLYAGTGSVGLEAWSRGAAQVMMVEHHPKALAVINANIQHLGPDPNLQVLPESVADAIRLLAFRNARFSHIFADPPYGQPLPLSDLAPLLAPDGLLILQLANDDAQATRPPPHLTPLEARRYGRTQLLFFTGN